MSSREKGSDKREKRKRSKESSKYKPLEQSEDSASSPEKEVRPPPESSSAPGTSKERPTTFQQNIVEVDKTKGATSKIPATGYQTRAKSRLDKDKTRSNPKGKEVSPSVPKSKKSESAAKGTSVLSQKGKHQSLSQTREKSLSPLQKIKGVLSSPFRKRSSDDRKDLLGHEEQDLQKNKRFDTRRPPTRGIVKGKPMYEGFRDFASHCDGVEEDAQQPLSDSENTSSISENSIATRAEHDLNIRESSSSRDISESNPPTDLEAGKQKDEMALKASLSPDLLNPKSSGKDSEDSDTNKSDDCDDKSKVKKSKKHEKK